MKTQDNIETLFEMFERTVNKYTSRPAFALKNQNGKIKYITYKDYYNDVLRFADILENKLKLKDEKIAICMKNCYEWCVSYMALYSAVAVVVPLDKDTIEEDLINIFSFADVKAAIVDKSNAEKLLKIYDRLPDGFKIISTEEVCDERIIDFYSFAKSDTTHIYNKNISTDPDKLAVLLFTSGTTGMAKGVMLSNKNILSDITAVSACFDLSCNDSTLCVLPLHHAYQSTVFLVILFCGGCVSFNERLRHIQSDLKAYNPTVFVTVPLMLEKMHDKIIKEISGNKETHDKFMLSSETSKHADDIKNQIHKKICDTFGKNLRFIVTGAAMMNEKAARDYTSFGIPVIIGYGLTECSPIAICNTQIDPRPDSIGKPIKTADVRIDRPDEYGVGEICIKGPMVMLGYYKNQEQTDEVIKDGWLHTGDNGYVDSDGFYHISGRIKNVIVTKNGKNIYPEELEYYLNGDPYIEESFVFSDGKENETVTATIVPDIEAIKHLLEKKVLIDEDIETVINEAVRKLNKKLPSYKHIKKINIRQSGLEKTATSKIKRNSLLNCSGDADAR